MIQRIGDATPRGGTDVGSGPVPCARDVPHIPPNGLLFGCILSMALGLAIALKCPQKPPKKSNE